jgi:hypothetical protein
MSLPDVSGWFQFENTNELRPHEIALIHWSHTTSPTREIAFVAGLHGKQIVYSHTLKTGGCLYHPVEGNIDRIGCYERLRVVEE